MNVVLIGMPGAGKSTVGVLAAKALGMDFTDTDLVIQTERGKTLAEIIAERGPSGFSEIEDDTLARLERDNCVIATGGSAVFCEKGMAHLAGRRKDDISQEWSRTICALAWGTSARAAWSCARAKRWTS